MGSVCSGIGGGELAFAGLAEHVFASEIDPFARAVLAHRFPELIVHGDFTTIQAGQYGPIDVLVGGTPCQSFSVAGLRGGMADARGNLALEYLRLADRLCPCWIVWENVPGVLSSNGGRDFGSFLGGLAELGYGWAYRSLDAQYFGVAQRRQRVFVVGCLGDWRRAWAVLAEPASLRGNPAPRRETREGIAAALRASTSPKGHGHSDGLRGDGSDNLIAFDAQAGGNTGFAIGNIPSALRGEDHGGGHAAVLAYGGNDTRGPIDVATACNAHGGPHGRLDFESETFVTAFDPRQIARPANFSNPKPGDPSHPLRDVANAEPAIVVTHSLRADGFDASEDGTGRGTPLAIASDSMVRRLMPIECERLQGFPDGWTDIPYRGKPAADGNRYRALGNAFAVPVVRWIARRLIAEHRRIAGEPPPLEIAAE